MTSKIKTKVIIILIHMNYDKRTVILIEEIHFFNFM